MFSKKEAQVKHAIKRAKQRFDLNLSKKDLIQIVKNIQNNVDCIFLKKESNRIFQFMIQYSGRSYRIVYDKKRKTIVTFLDLRKSIEELQKDDFNKTGLNSTTQAKFEENLKNELSELWKE